MALSPDRLMRAMVYAQKLRAELADELPRLGETSLREAYESETQVLEVMDELVALATQDSLYIERLETRYRRLKTRREQTRNTILQMMLELGLTKEKVERAHATLWLDWDQSVNADVSLLPDEYVSRTPDKRKISKALENGAEIPGASLSNPSPSLNIRSL